MARTEPSHRFHGRILLAIPDAELCEPLAEKTMSAGAEVMQTSLGETAIEQTLEQYFEVAFFAASLPDMSALEAIQMLRELGYGKPIYLVTENIGAVFECGEEKIPTVVPQVDEILERISRHISSPHTEETQPVTKASKGSAIPQGRLPSRFEELIAAFEKDLPQTLATISDFILREQWSDLQRVVHQLKGCAGSLGHPQLTDISQAMLSAIKSGSFFDICAYYGEMARYIAAIPICHSNPV